MNRDDEDFQDCEIIPKYRYLARSRCHTTLPGGLHNYYSTPNSRQRKKVSSKSVLPANSTWDT